MSKDNNVKSKPIFSKLLTKKYYSYINLKKSIDLHNAVLYIKYVDLTKN